MGFIFELEAVNHMLLMAGESTVSSLSAETDVDTEVARLLLDQFRMDYLLRGTVGNRLLKKVYPDVAGKIELTADILSAELVSYHENDDGLMLQANIRGFSVDEDPANPLPYLFNITDGTSVWVTTTEYTVEYIYNLDWVDIDTPFQRAIMAASARQYQIVMQGDYDSDAYLAQVEAFYSAKAKGANIDDRRRHVFSQLGYSAKGAVTRVDTSTDPARFRYWRTNNGG